MGGYQLDNNLKWLKQITEVPGISGFENRVKAVLVEKLSDKAEVSSDKIGSVIFKKTGTAEGPKIMLAAHMDEIGFIVKTITKEGYLKFTTVGGWWEQVMLGQRVTVSTAKGDIPGLIGCKPPHVISAEERKKVVQKKDMFIDVGAADEKEAREVFGVRPGDAVTPYSEFVTMANDKFLMTKAWDNRVGCAIMADIIEELHNMQHPNDVYGVGTVQEEVGLRGAKTSAALVDPDVSFSVDVTTAGDTPGIQEDQAAAKLGKGVAISVYDTGMIPHKPLRDFVIQTAEENNIPYQLDFMEGGATDVGRIHLHGCGVPSVAIGIPSRYIHSHNSVIHRDDYNSAKKLLLCVLQKLNKQKYEELVK